PLPPPSCSRPKLLPYSTHTCSFSSEKSRMRHFQWSTIILGVLALFAACGEKQGDPSYPREQSYFAVGHDAMQDDEVLKSFGVYLKILAPEDLRDDWSWDGTDPDRPWERVQLYGHALSSDLAWVDDA